MGYYINKTKIVSDAIAQTGRFETIVSVTNEIYNPSISINKYWFVTPKLMFNISPSVGSYYNKLTNYNFINNPALPETERGNTQIGTS
jgi:hypothetical protein